MATQPKDKTTVRHLLNFPTELRLEIFNLAISSQEPTSIDEEGKHPILLSLLFVCKSIREEAMQLYCIHIRRHELEAQKTLEKIDAELKTFEGARSDELYETYRAVFKAYVKARKMMDCTEWMLERFGYPWREWLAAVRCESA